MPLDLPPDSMDPHAEEPSPNPRRRIAPRPWFLVLLGLHVVAGAIMVALLRGSMAEQEGFALLFVVIAGIVLGAMLIASLFISLFLYDLIARTPLGSRGAGWIALLLGPTLVVAGLALLLRM